MGSRGDRRREENFYICSWSEPNINVLRVLDRGSEKPKIIKTSMINLFHIKYEKLIMNVVAVFLVYNDYQKEKITTLKASIFASNVSFISYPEYYVFF